MYDTQNALLAHIEAVKSELELASVAEYSGELANATATTHILPAALTLFKSLSSSRTHEVLYFSVLLLTENIEYERETNAAENMRLSKLLYDWLKDNATFSDLNFHYVIGIRKNEEPMKLNKPVRVHRYMVADLELTIKKMLTNRQYMYDRDGDFIEDRDGAFQTLQEDSL